MNTNSAFCLHQLCGFLKLDTETDLPCRGSNSCEKIRYSLLTNWLHKWFITGVKYWRSISGIPCKVLDVSSASHLALSKVLNFFSSLVVKLKILSRYAGNWFLPDSVDSVESERTGRIGKLDLNFVSVVYQVEGFLWARFFFI